MAIDEPRYTAVRTHDAFEVRQYEPYQVAETVVNAAAEGAGNQGFRILAAMVVVYLVMVEAAKQGFYRWHGVSDQTRRAKGSVAKFPSA